MAHLGPPEGDEEEAIFLCTELRGLVKHQAGVLDPMTLPSSSCAVFVSDLPSSC